MQRQQRIEASLRQEINAVAVDLRQAVNVSVRGRRCVKDEADSGRPIRSLMNGGPSWTPTTTTWFSCSGASAQQNIPQEVVSNHGPELPRSVVHVHLPWRLPIRCRQQRFRTLLPVSANAFPLTEASLPSLNQRRRKTVCSKDLQEEHVRAWNGMPSEESGSQLVNSICPLGIPVECPDENARYITMGTTLIHASSESSILKCVIVQVV
jgi:hypothetical protein